MHYVSAQVTRSQEVTPEANDECVDVFVPNDPAQPNHWLPVSQVTEWPHYSTGNNREHSSFSSVSDGFHRVTSEGTSEAAARMYPEWAQQKAAEQKFTAGRLHGFVEAWREAGADSQVMQWLEHGHHVVLDDQLLEEARAAGEQCEGFEMENGKKAQIPC